MLQGCRLHAPSAWMCRLLALLVLPLLLAGGARMHVASSHLHNDSSSNGGGGARAHMHGAPTVPKLLPHRCLLASSGDSPGIRLAPKASPGLAAVLTMWQQARAELGVELSADEVQSAAELARRLSFTTAGLYTSSTRTAVYVRMPKAGNDNIKCNLQLVPTFTAAKLTRGDLKPTLHEQPLGKEVGLVEVGDERAFTLTGLPFFTYVRRPVMRFVSAYAEIEFRHMVQNKSYGFDYERLPRGQPERFAEFVRWLLRGRIWAQAKGKVADVLPETEVYHLYLISAMIQKLSRHSVYVSNLEDIRQTWGEMMRTVGLVPKGERPPVLDAGLCQHTSSQDDARLSSSAKSALASDVRLMRALCWMLLPDFHAFRYALPRACGDMALSVHGMPLANITRAANGTVLSYVELPLVDVESLLSAPPHLAAAAAGGSSAWPAGKAASGKAAHGARALRGGVHPGGAADAP